MRGRIIGLIVILVLGLLAAPLLAGGQKAGKVYRIGFLGPVPTVPGGKASSRHS